MRAWLIDTGPLVAYLDAGEGEHGEVAAHLDAFTGQLFTTSAVITEAMHFVAPARRGALLLAELVAASGLQVFDFSHGENLMEAARRSYFGSRSAPLREQKCPTSGAEVPHFGSRSALT